MDRTVTDVLTEHRCGINATECDAPGCDWAPDRNLGDWRRQHAEHVAVEIRSAQVAAGLSRVLTDPERAALDRLRRDKEHWLPATADIDALVAVVERLAAAPAPEALVDAVAEALAVLAGVATPGKFEETAGYAREYWRREARRIVSPFLVVVGQAATHDTDTQRLSGHRCDNCEGVAIGTCLFNPDRQADDEVERLAASRAAATDSGEGR